MKAVVYTDVIQAIVMLVGLVAMVAIGVSTVGGITTVFDIANQGGRLEFFKCVFLTDKSSSCIHNAAEMISIFNIS